MGDTVDRIAAPPERVEPHRPPQSKSLTDRLAQFWSVQLPIWLDPWAPRLAEALADGAWTYFWRRGRWTALLPVVALAVGFLTPVIGLRHATAEGSPFIYSQSLWFMVAVVGGAILSGPVGVMLLIGYSLGDLIGYFLLGSHGYYSNAFITLVGRVIGYMVLGVLALRIPLLARRMTEEVSPPSNPVVRVAMRPALYAITSGGLVYLWCQATIALIRPVFTWGGYSPSVVAIAQVQVHWKWLVVTAMAAAVARIVLEGIACSPTPSGSVVVDLRQQRWPGIDPPGQFWQWVPALVRVGVASAVITLLLAGLYERWFDALLVAITTAALGAWHAGLIGTVPSGWANAVNKVPGVFRFGVGVVLGYLTAGLIMHLLWRFGSFRVVLLGAIVTMVVFHLLFPQLSERNLEPRQTK